MYEDDSLEEGEEEEEETKDSNYATSSSLSSSTTTTTTTTPKAEHLLAYTLAILKTVDLKASDGRAEDFITEFLGRANARLFLHELNAWMRSPCEKLGEWDRVVQYARAGEGEGLMSSVDGRGMEREREREGRGDGRSGERRERAGNG